MKGEHYTVHRNRGYFQVLSAVFPEQTKSTVSIIVWSIILLLELTIGVLGAFHFGFLTYDNFSNFRIIILLGGIIVAFWLQGFIWGLLMKILKKDEL